MMTSDEVRAAFLSFFEERGHKIVPSSSLIPKNDPTLLLTTAGMVPFKPYFLGEEKPANPRLVSCQKCFRTTDIESVGDPTHLTFFEMLGNFSVGDYFKREAINWAWEFVAQRLGLEPERLWVTIFLDDDESFGYWREVGVPEERILRFGEKDNFWGPAGDSGPCGPCSEIHYDFGQKFGCGKPSCAPNCNCGRFSEIWNLVFTQYNQDRKGKRTPLPRPNIDTGMGLERTAAVVQGKTSVYETDLFVPLIQRIAKLAGVKYGSDDDVDNTIRIIAEHSRGIAFLIADGVIPDRDGRGYVLRKLLRRTQYFSETLAHDKPFITEVAQEVIINMGHVYPELVKNRKHILDVIESEVESFRRTLPVGEGILNNTLLKMREELRDYLPKFERAFRGALSSNDFLDLRDGVNNTVEHFQRDCGAWWHTLIIGGRDVIKETLQPIEDDLERFKTAVSYYKANRPDALFKLKQDLQEIFEDLETHVGAVRAKLSGLEVFILHDTYGFPVELTIEIAADRGFSVDLEGFEKEMAKQKERAKASHKFVSGQIVAVEEGKITVRPARFVGYQTVKCKSIILDLSVDNKSVDIVKEGQEASLVLQDTPFYGEMGGQVGDIGEIRSLTGRFTVTNTIHPQAQPDVIVHQGKVIEGSLSVGDEVEAIVDKERRLDIARNHTATHLLQMALRQVLGGHVQQRGSLVAPDRLRFDFSHLKALTKEQIAEVNRIVNEKIRQNLKVSAEDMPYKKAMEEGVIALFDEKYGDIVRAVKIGEPMVSAELCGGTHVTSTGEIGLFHIISESSIGSGLRRIEAVTGKKAEEFVERRLDALAEMASKLATEVENTSDKVDDLIAELDNERKQKQTLERKLDRIEALDLLEYEEEIKGVKLLVAEVHSSRIEGMWEMADFIRDKLESAVVVLGMIYGDKPFFVAAVTSDLVEKGYHAGEIVKQVARVTGGGGGGKADFAQAGGKDKKKLDEALKMVKSLI